MKRMSNIDVVSALDVTTELAEGHRLTTLGQDKSVSETGSAIGERTG